MASEVLKREPQTSTPAPAPAAPPAAPAPPPPTAAPPPSPNADPTAAETREWLDPSDAVLQPPAPDRPRSPLAKLKPKAVRTGAETPSSPTPPSITTTPASR